MMTDTHRHTIHCWWDHEQARWVCGAAPAAETPATPETPTTTEPLASERSLVDVRDMIVVHAAMLREFRLLPEAVTRTDPDDVRRVAAVAGHLAFLCELLHHHHEGEDALLWPTLRERTTASAGRLIDDVEAQHAGLDAALAEVGERREAWTARPTAAGRDALAAQLTALHDLLREHLELEERALLPLAAAYLSEAEWDAIGEAAVAAMPKPALALAFGMFAYEGDPAVLRGMLHSAPAVPRVLLPRIAPRLYAWRARTVHGTARP